MILHPNVQAKAQRELDSVVGRDRLPSITDGDKLPYLKSILTEILRTCMCFRFLFRCDLLINFTAPPAPLGLPHSAKDWQTYGELAIPANSIIVPNIWSVLASASVLTGLTLIPP